MNIDRFDDNEDWELRFIFCAVRELREGYTYTQRKRVPIFRDYFIECLIFYNLLLRKERKNRYNIANFLRYCWLMYTQEEMMMCRLADNCLLFGNTEYIIWYENMRCLYYDMHFERCVLCLYIGFLQLHRVHACLFRKDEYLRCKLCNGGR